MPIRLLINVTYAAFFLLLLSCSGEDPEPAGEVYSYVIPEETEDGWKCGSLLEAGMDTVLPVSLVNKIRDGIITEVHSVVVARHGKLVLEAYFPGHDFAYHGANFHGDFQMFYRHTPHNTHSATKSIVSALMGIAIHKGYVQGVDDPVFDYFPSYSHLATGDKAGITIAHLLTMSAGLNWNDSEVPPGDPAWDTYQFSLADDPLAYILERDLVADPGSEFYYNNALVDLAGEIIHVAYGMPVDSFCEHHLFGPMGVKHRWPVHRTGMVISHGDIYITPRDMAKFGQLFLQDGSWEGQPLVPEEWIAASLSPQAPLYPLTAADGYGYLWWLREYRSGGRTIRSAQARGWGGQRIIVLPDQDMVVAFTGANYVGGNPCDQILLGYILPSVLDL